MRIVLFFDQIQSGTGGKEGANVELALEKGGMGSYMMFSEYIKNIGGTVLATTYCSDSYFKENQELVLEKMTGLLNKVKADILLCGPCFNYYNYAEMSSILAEHVKKETNCKPVVVCSEENKEIFEYFYKKTIIKKEKLEEKFKKNDIKELEEKSYKIQNRVLLARYRGKTRCHSCHGRRLRKEANYVKIQGKSISDLVEISIEKLQAFFRELTLSPYEQEVAKRLLIEINSRLQFLSDVGLGYLTLNRKSNTLSGGESQRINLATSLGSSLVGSMYILDEPSIGLHPRDTHRLIKVLKSLRDLGNTVIVVEHDADIMKAADYIIDIGPEAGTHGGEVVAAGTYEQLLKADTLTGKYLSGRLSIEPPKKRRTSPHYISLIGCRENNLKNIDVTFPLDMLTIVTGVSGSGKSTLIKKLLYPAMQKELNASNEKIGQFTRIEGKYKQLQSVEFVDQNPIGKSSRSNPITYLKVYDDIRNLYANQKLAKMRNFSAKHFSFNVDGGRCEVCKGEGEVTIEMQFMADVHLTCEACGGKRFKKEVLEITYEGKNIDDLLNTTIDDAVAFFAAHKQTKIAEKLKPLQDVGLGYVTLGQSSSTLSGGEAQRIKLASFLSKSESKEKVLFIFDEPTTGLHFHDIRKLLDSLQALIEKGHSVIVIEHNLEMIKCADYVIDLGLEGGEKGGSIIAKGTPEEIAKCKESYTGSALANDK